MKILIVDDNEDSRMILKKNLGHDGHTVQTASNGIEALKTARESPTDMIISDILMPEMDGFRLCREVKKDKQLKKIPFVFYTATYVDPNDEKLAMALGASRYILKPIDTAEFLKIINEAFQEYKEKKLPVPEKPLEESDVLSRMYKESITRKLDKKVQELEIAKAKIENSERCYRNLFNSIRDVIIIADLDRNILDANQLALREVFGYEREEIFGKNARILYAHEETYKLAGREIFDSKEFVPGKIIEVDFRKKNGEIFRGELYALKLIDDDRVPTGNIGIIRDITKRKKIEKEVKDRIEELEKFYEMAVGREVKMKQLKEEIERLKSELSKYKTGDSNR